MYRRVDRRRNDGAGGAASRRLLLHQVRQEQQGRQEGPGKVSKSMDGYI